MTDRPKIPMFELRYEWPVVIILGGGERLNLSTLDNTDYERRRQHGSQGIAAAPFLASVGGH